MVSVSPPCQRTCRLMTLGARPLETVMSRTSRRANDMQLCLSEGAFHAQDQRVVELGWIVTTILVDHEGVGDGAKFQKPMPVLVRTRQARDLQRKNRADMAHGHVADQDLEVGAVGGGGSGLAQIAVQNPDLILTPTEGLSLVHQIVLTLGALLVEPNLARRRLPDVDAGLSRQVTWVDLRGHQGHRASPPQRAAGRRRDRP